MDSAFTDLIHGFEKRVLTLAPSFHNQLVPFDVGCRNPP
jgi:hypothetical protein